MSQQSSTPTLARLTLCHYTTVLLVSTIIFVASLATRDLAYGQHESSTAGLSGSHEGASHVSGSQLDVVLLIDSSGSMLSTDPLKLRYEGAQLLLTFLDKNDRLSIVSFAGTAEVKRPLAAYTEVEAAEVKKTILGTESTGEYTDLLEAIKVGKKVLEDSPREGAQRVIVLLSDGRMEPNPTIVLPSIPASELSRELIEKSATNRIQDLVTNYLPEFKAQEIKIHTLAFSDRADSQLLSEIAATTDGLSWFTASAADIHKSFADLFLAVKKPQVVPLTSRGFRIEEGIQEATFYVVHDEGAALTMSAPSGTIIRPEAPPPGVKWFVGQKFDVITLEKPGKGDWQIKGVASKDSFATVLTNLKLTTEWPSSIRSEDPVVLQARLFEAEKPVALPSMSGVIKYAFQISPTDKVSEPILRETLVDDATQGDLIAQDGVFSKEIKLLEPGEYKLTVVARGPTFQRSQQIPFRVRPRLITLEALSLEEQGQHAHGHGNSSRGDAGSHDKSEDDTKHDEHHEDTAKQDKHGDEEPAKSSEHAPTSSKSELIQGDGRWIFRVKVSNEVASFKKYEVSLTAKNANRKKYILPLKRTIDDPQVYEFIAGALPADGQYLIEAEVEGETKKKQDVKAKSRPLKFERKTSSLDSNLAVRVVLDKDIEPPKPTAPILELIAVILVNFGIGAFAFKKVKSGGKTSDAISQPYKISENLSSMVRSLEELATKGEVDFDDPIFAEELEAQPPIPEIPQPEEGGEE